MKLPSLSFVSRIVPLALPGRTLSPTWISFAQAEVKHRSWEVDKVRPHLLLHDVLHFCPAKNCLCPRPAANAGLNGRTGPRLHERRQNVAVFTIRPVS
jgi:hypothetical protein